MNLFSRLFSRFTLSGRSSKAVSAFKKASVDLISIAQSADKSAAKKLIRITKAQAAHQDLLTLAADNRVVANKISKLIAPSEVLEDACEDNKITKEESKEIKDAFDKVN